MSSYRIAAKADGLFSFALIDDAGRRLLSGTNYPSRESASLAVERCRANGLIRKNYIQTTGEDGRPCFHLVDMRGHRLAEGPACGSDDECEACIADCLRIAASDELPPSAAAEPESGSKRRFSGRGCPHRLQASTFG